MNQYAGTKVIGAQSLEEMVSKLKQPRRVMMLVKAGSAVDGFIEKLVPLLEKGDIIIDGGNSEYTDSIVCSCSMHVEDAITIYFTFSDVAML